MRSKLLKGTIITLAITAIISAIYILIRARSFFQQPEFDRRVLIDSIGLHNNEILYWFYEVDGLGDKATTFRQDSGLDLLSHKTRTRAYP